MAAARSEGTAGPAAPPAGWRGPLPAWVPAAADGFNAAWGVAGSALLLVTVLWTSLFAHLEMEREAAYVENSRRAGNLVRTLEEHTVRTVRGIDQANLFVQRGYEQAGRGFDLQRLAADGTFIDPYFNLIAVADADGDRVLASRPRPPSSIADREHFRAHRNEDNGALLISKPVLGRSSGNWSIHFTRRINNRDGSFGGVVVTSVDPDYFASFYRQLDLGEGGVATLVGMDGIVRARRNGEQGDAGQDISGTHLFQQLARSDTGTYMAASPLDGRRRLYAYRRLKQYPLVVVVGISESVVLDEYHEHGAALRAMGIAMSGLVLVLALALVLVLRSQRRAQDSLRESERQAQSASRMKSEFLARMSHELRTPLNGILGFSEYLKDSLEQPEQREFAATINQAGTHLLALVNTTLDLAKIEAGRMEVSLRDETVRPLVERVVAIQRAFASGKGLPLSLDVAADVPETLRLDATRLAQVLNNLVHNAIKFTDRGSVSVRLSRPVPGETLYEVRDTGAGIPADQQALAFDRFRQLDSFQTRSKEGSGLGLALAKELVELMGGRIGLDSTPGSGSCFHFSLPDRGPAPAGTIPGMQ
jgi:two-component system sensor histidine kinase BarA